MQPRFDRKTINALAIAVIIGIVAIVIISILVSRQTSELFGPSVLAGDARGHVYVNLGSSLYKLDAYGHVLDTTNQAELGLPAGSYTDVLALPDGRLLIALARPGRIFSCDFEQRACSNFIQADVHISETLKMTWHEALGQLFVVDAAAGVIRVLDADGQLQGSFEGGEKGLILPNTALIDNDGSLVVADTNHHRIVAFSTTNPGEELWSTSVKSDFAKPGRRWPTDIAQDASGRYWSIHDGNHLRYGDVVLYDSERKPGKRLALDEKWDPIKLFARDNDMLVASFGNFELISVSLDGESIYAFGSEEFKTIMLEAYTKLRSYEMWFELWIWLILTPLLLLLVYVVYLDGVVKRAEKAARAVVHRHPVQTATGDFDGDGTFWLAHNKDLMKKLNTFKKLLPAMIILVMLSPLLVLEILNNQLIFLFALLIFGMYIPMTVYFFYMARRLSSAKIGINKQGEVVLKNRAGMIAATPDKVYFNHRFISANNIFVTTRTTQDVFNEDDTRLHLEPLLKRANKLDFMQAFLHQVRNKPGFVTETVLMTLYFAILFGILFIVK